MLPKNMPRILTLSVTEVIFAGPSGQPPRDPIHSPSVFETFRREPDPRAFFTENARVTEKSFTRMRVVSLAYCDTLLCLRGAPGERYLLY